MNLQALCLEILLYAPAEIRAIVEQPDMRAARKGKFYDQVASDA